MLRETGLANDPSTILPGLEGLSWTFDTVEDRLIEAAACWRRAPGGQRKQIMATDGPWHLIVADAGDYDARGGDGVSSDVVLRPASLSRAEVGRMEEATRWVELYVGESDRRIVWMALFHKADGRTPDWRWIMGQVGLRRGVDGVRMRYNRAVGAIAKAVDRARVPVVLARL